jgi:hypothetical protein
MGLREVGDRLNSGRDEGENCDFAAAAIHLGKACAADIEQLVFRVRGWEISYSVAAGEV